MSARHSPMLLPLHAATAMVCLALLVLWPPVSGRMLLIPLSGDGEGSVARPAIAAGALLLGSGPIAGSLVVIGERSRVMATTTSRAILVVAAPSAGCGANVTQEIQA